MKHAKRLWLKLFWFVAAIFFGGLVFGQTREGIWSVQVIRSPMGDRSFAVASSEATENFNGQRPRLVIACEVTRDGTSHGLNVFVDLGSPLVLADSFKGRNKELQMTFKVDEGKRASDKWHQSETFRELFHDAATESDQRAFVRWLSDSKQFLVDIPGADNKTIGFITKGLKPYYPVMAQACGWHK